MTRWLCGGMLWAALAIGEAAAQDTVRVNALEAGAYSLTFRLPESGSGSVGMWRMASDQVNLGVVLDLSVQSNRLDEAGTSRTERRQRLSVQPLLVRYLSSEARVAPFVFGGLFLNHFRSSASESSTRTRLTGKTTHFGVSGGGGAEWFPVRQVSIGGRVGVQLGVSRGGEEIAADRDESGFFFNTFTTNLILRIYFP